MTQQHARRLRGRPMFPVSWCSRGRLHFQKRAHRAGLQASMNGFPIIDTLLFGLAHTRLTAIPAEAAETLALMARQ